MRWLSHALIREKLGNSKFACEVRLLERGVTFVANKKKTHVLTPGGRKTGNRSFASLKRDRGWNHRQEK